MHAHTHRSQSFDAHKKMALCLLFAVVNPYSVHAEDICSTSFEYRLTSPPIDSALSAVGDDQSSARNALESKLNALGADGWRLLSVHSVRVHTADTVELGLAESALSVADSGKASKPQSIAELVPASALFERETSRCRTE